MHPVIPDTHVGPQRRRVREAPLQQGPQSTQLLEQGPLFSIRSRLIVMALRRSWSVRPEASNGGRPSSVRALRTAAQSPRTTAATGSSRPSRLPFDGAHPANPLLAFFFRHLSKQGKSS